MSQFLFNIYNTIIDSLTGNNQNINDAKNSVSNDDTNVVDSNISKISDTIILRPKLNIIFENPETQNKEMIQFLQTLRDKYLEHMDNFIVNHKESCFLKCGVVCQGLCENYNITKENCTDLLYSHIIGFEKYLKSYLPKDMLDKMDKIEVINSIFEILDKTLHTDSIYIIKIANNFIKSKIGYAQQTKTFYILYDKKWNVTAQENIMKELANNISDEINKYKKILESFILSRPETTLKCNQYLGKIEKFNSHLYRETILKKYLKQSTHLLNDIDYPIEKEGMVCNNKDVVKFFVEKYVVMTDDKNDILRATELYEKYMLWMLNLNRQKANIISLQGFSRCIGYYLPKFKQYKGMKLYINVKLK